MLRHLTTMYENVIHVHELKKLTSYANDLFIRLWNMVGALHKSKYIIPFIRESRELGLLRLIFHTWQSDHGLDLGPNLKTL